MNGDLYKVADKMADSAISLATSVLSNVVPEGTTKAELAQQLLAAVSDWWLESDVQNA